MTLQRLLAAAAALGLSGCAVGPNYHAPLPPPGATGPWQMSEAARTAPTAPPDDWWRLYNDPKLDGYVAEAFAANHDLAAAQANLSASRAILTQARSGRYPSTTTVAGAVRGRDAVTDEILGIVGHKNETIWKYDDILDVSYELDLFGRVRRSLEAARADTGAAAAARDAVKITVAAETTRAYVTICALGEEIDVAQHSLDVVSHQLDITRKRVAAGDASDFDQARSATLVAQVRATLPPLEGQRRSALFELTALLGKTPAQAPKDALACRSPPQLSALIPVGDGAGLLARRPDIREAERKLAGATARIGVATADLYPRITLSGFYGGAAGNNTAALLEEKGLTWGVGPAISWAFPNQAAVRARIRASKAGAEAALDQFDESVLRGLKESEQSLSTYGAELDRRQALGEAQIQARKAFDLAHGQVSAGSISALDLLTSEQQLVAADGAVAQSNAALVQDQVTVFKALGGGWRSGPKPPG